MLKLLLLYYRKTWRMNLRSNLDLSLILVMFVFLLYSDKLKSGFFLPYTVIITTLLTCSLPNRITKGMFVFPMTLQKQKTFIRISISLKIILSMLFFIIGGIVFNYLLLSSPIVFLYKLLFFFMYALLYNLNSIGFVLLKGDKTLNNQREVQEHFRPSKERFLSSFGIVFNIMILAFYDYDFDFGMNFTLLTLAFLFSVLMTSFYIKKYAASIINICVDYEAIYTPMTHIRRTYHAHNDFLSQ